MCDRSHPSLWLQGSARAICAERFLAGGKGARRLIPTLSKAGVSHISWGHGAVSSGWESHYVLPSPAPLAQTPKLREGKPTRHLLPVHRESEEETGSEWGVAALGPHGHRSLARWALTPSPVSLRREAETDTIARGEIVLTWESQTGGGQAYPLRAGKGNSSDLHIPQLGSHQSPTDPSGTSSPPQHLSSQLLHSLALSCLYIIKQP